jgi:hypothetical protein
MKKIHTLAYTSVIKLPLLVNLQQKAGELVLSITSSLSIIILENTLNLCIKKCGYGKFDHRYYVYSFHLLALLDIKNFTNVIRVCADRL